MSQTVASIFCFADVLHCYYDLPLFYLWTFDNKRLLRIRKITDLLLKLGGRGGVFAWNYCKYTFSQNTDDFTVSKNKFTQKRRIYFTFPTKKDTLKINIRNTRTICEICSDLEIKAPDVILVSFLVNFEHNLHLNLLLLLLTLNMYWSIFTPE